MIIGYHAAVSLFALNRMVRAPLSAQVHVSPRATEALKTSTSSAPRRHPWRG
jgi:hypothetical protein